MASFENVLFLNLGKDAKSISKSNILANVGQNSKTNFAKQLKQIWLQPDKEKQSEIANLIAKEFKTKFPKARDMFI